MGAVDIILNYFSRSSIVSIVVLGWLSLYFILSFSILLSRMSGLALWYKAERDSLESLVRGSMRPSIGSALSKCANSGENINERKLRICLLMAQKRATSGLAWLSIIASTSPFIGLFGTVVSILETFAGLGNGVNSSLSVIAPAISEALVATAAGILVAIPAYSFNILLKRRSYELVSVIEQQVDLLNAREKSELDA